MLEYGFENFTIRKIAEKEGVALSYKYDEENQRSVKLIYKKNFNIAVKKDDVITTKIEKSTITLPAKKGTIAGCLHIYCNGDEVGKVDLITQRSIKKLSFSDRIRKKLKDFFSVLY